MDSRLDLTNKWANICNACGKRYKRKWAWRRARGATIFAHSDNTAFGVAARSLVIENWATIRNSAGNEFSDEEGIGSQISATDIPDYKFCVRGGVSWDTSGLSGSPTSGSVWGKFLTSSNDFSGVYKIGLYGMDFADPTNMTQVDYVNTGTTAYSDTLIDVTDSYSEGTWYELFPLNAAGIAAIDASGYSEFSLRLDRDAEDNELADANKNVWFALSKIALVLDGSPDDTSDLE